MSVYSKPDFIHVGPTKTGTTWLHHHLQRHPDVWLPPVKEVNFFWGLGKKHRIPPLKNFSIADLEIFL